MNEVRWKQVNVAYPGQSRRQRESHAVKHLSSVLPAAEADGLLTAWWFIRKGPWRIRYVVASDSDDTDPVHELLTDRIAWTHGIYEPEVHAFGGPASMDAAHALFHLDSRHLLQFLSDDPDDRRERSLILCTALMRSAGLDLNEQGDVWARVAELRARVADQLPSPGPQIWESFTSDIRQLLLGTVRADAIEPHWLAAFEETGNKLGTLRASGELTRGIRAVIALHVIFHWNRIGLFSSTQAILARAAQAAIFADTPA